MAEVAKLSDSDLPAKTKGLVTTVAGLWGALYETNPSTRRVWRRRLWYFMDQCPSAEYMESSFGRPGRSFAVSIMPVAG